jgi:hypothetical protein
MRHMRKLIIELWNDPEVLVKQGEVSEALDVVTVARLFDFEAYRRRSSDEQKREILDVIRAGTATVIKRYQLAQEPFDDAVRCCLEKGLRHEFWWGKRVRSPDHKRFAQVWIEYEQDRIDVSAVAFDRQGQEVVRQKVVTTPPHEIHLVDVLGRLRWEGRGGGGSRGAPAAAGDG